MSEKNEIVLTSDEAMYKMQAALVERAKVMEHGKIEFTGTMTIHGGKIMDVIFKEAIGGLHWRTTKDDS